MNMSMENKFNDFLSQLKDSNQTLNFFCDFDKISENVRNIELSLNTLNYLLGKDDIEQAVHEIWQRDKRAFEVMDILIAVRDNGKKRIVDSYGNSVLLKDLFLDEIGVIEFLKQTGLAELFRNRRIKNLVDYVFGIETGLDSNARKNRSGFIMEKTIEDIFTRYSIKFKKEVNSSEYPSVASVLGNDEKRFDFVVEKENITYLIEVNFYSGGGSKLNEVARSYSEIAPKINSLGNFKFIWITDGVGWKSAKNKLQEAFNIIPNIYNLTTIQEFIGIL